MSRTHHERRENNHSKSDENEIRRSSGAREKRRHHRERDPTIKRKHNRNKFCAFLKAFVMGLLQQLLAIFHILVDSLLECVLGLYWGPKTTCPPVTKDGAILNNTAVQLAKLIREKKLSSYDVVKAYVSRMDELKSSINAVASGPVQNALIEAKAIDEKIEAGLLSSEDFERKPFLGVPFTTKDSTAVKGLPLTLGLVSRKSVFAKEDAECVRLMKEAGAVIIATSNVPEVNKWIETRNNLFGQTNNPYDLRRSVGGSSGGEGALIAACGSIFGLGTDIGGSIRIPSFNCGVFGHKPTEGVVNTKGCTFRTGKEPSTMVVAGPMTRYATDLLPIFKIIADPEAVTNLKLDEKVDLKKLKYYFIPSMDMPQCNPIGKETKTTMSKVIEHFAELTGENPAVSKLPGTRLAGKMWRYWMTQEPADFNAMLGNGVKLNPFVELAKKLIGQSQYTMAAIFALIDGILPPENAKVIKEATEKCEAALNELLGDDGVLFFQSSPRTAPFHYYPLFQFNDFHYFSLFNVLRVPATQVPMGLDRNGMPLGIQVIASKNRDRHCLAVAEELERTFGGWVPPFTL